MVIRVAELREYLERVLERLYAGFYIYSAMAYLVWLPVLAVFMLLWSIPQIASLPNWAKGLFSILYWLGAAAVLVGLVMKHYWKRYIERLAAKLEATSRAKAKPCARFLTLWITTPIIIIGLPMVLNGILGEAAYAMSVAVGLAVGNMGNVLTDRCYGLRWPPPLISVLMLIASLPLIVVGVWGALVMVIMASYALVAIAYLAMALSRLD